MRYKQLIAGFALGVMFSYASMRVVHHFQRLGGFSAITAGIGQPAQASPADGDGNAVHFSKFDLSATANLGVVTFHYDFVPSDGGGDTVMQLFLDVAGNWQCYVPSDPNGNVCFHLQQNEDCAGQFTIDLPKGSYTAYRAILFASPDGKNADYGHALYDSSKDTILKNVGKMDVEVTSSSVPAGTPTIILPPNPVERNAGGGLTDVTFPAVVRYSSDYSVDGGGFWVMAKGDAGFAQVFANVQDAEQSTDPDHPGLQIPVRLTLTGVKPGLWNIQIGLFKPSWGSPIQWIWPGPTFETGGDSWEVRADQTVIPPRLQVADGHFELLTGTPYNFYRNEATGTSAVGFVRGGDYGNAINFKPQPALNTPAYFSSLAAMGCHFIRFNYNPDSYLEERAYRGAVDQVVQNIWSAGLYPIIAPQDLPNAPTVRERIAKGDQLLHMIASRYAGYSIWIEICNEPHEFGSWNEWKPVAEQYVKTIRAIDPTAFVVVPFEFYSLDGRGAAASPITDTHVDLYDGHAYVGAADVSAHFEPAIKAGLPVLIGEYGGSDPSYMHAMDRSFQSLPKQPLAIAPWAFTIKGEDTLPLIEDASSTSLVYTPAGQSIADDFGAWNAGRKIE